MIRNGIQYSGIENQKDSYSILVSLFSTPGL
jgi:hypothetical protein